MRLLDAALASAGLATMVAALVAIFLVRSTRVHGAWSADHDFDGPQKFHANSVPRVGGLAIWLAVFCGLAVWAWLRPDDRLWIFLLMAVSLPAFLGGLVEDLTKRVSPAKRMLTASLSALLSAYFLGGVISRTDVPGLDWIASVPLGAAILAVFVVAGVTNAVNIIDGFNGLASMCCMIMFAGLGLIAFQVGDVVIALTCAVLIAATFGFFLLNYPHGLIFLGDGGAYFLGFMLAELGILLLVRNHEVSPLFPLVLCAYPIVETVFSMYRRKFVRGRSVGAPDGVHLHSLVYRRLIRWAVGTSNAKELVKRNSLTAPYLWVACAASVVPSALWWNNTRALLVVLLIYFSLYVLVYRSIVRFRSPRWLIRRVLHFSAQR